MNTLPTKRPQHEPVEAESTPTWRELRERLRDLMDQVVQEGKELERDLEPKLLPALRKVREQIEKLIGTLETRASKRG